MVEVKAETNDSMQISLGRQGEHLAREIVFDVSDMIERYGMGRAELLHQRHEEPAPYPCVITQEENRVIWKLTAADTGLRGDGKAELRWYVGDTLAKSVLYQTLTLPALGEGQTEPPEPWKGWVDEILQEIEWNGATPEQVGKAVEQYLAEHPVVAVVG